MNRFIIFGCGGFSVELFQLFDSEQKNSCHGFIGGGTGISLPKPYLGDDSILGEIINSNLINGYMIAIGDPIARARCHSLVEHLAIMPQDFISKQAIIVNSLIGAGCIIYPQASIMSGCSIGVSTVVNCNATLGHDTKVGNFCNINPGANIAGFVSIGDSTTIGIGATVKEGVTIGKNVMVGAGSVVVRNVPNDVVVYGNPAKYES